MDELVRKMPEEVDDKHKEIALKIQAWISSMDARDARKAYGAMLYTVLKEAR